MKKTIIFIIITLLSISVAIYCYETYFLKKSKKSGVNLSLGWDCERIVSKYKLSWFNDNIIDNNQTAEDIKGYFRQFKIIEDGNDLIIVNGILNDNYSGGCPDYDDTSHAFIDFGKKYIVWGDVIVKNVETYDNVDIKEYNSSLVESEEKYSNQEVSQNESNQEKNYCSLSLAETFTFLTDNSPFNLGSTGSVNFTKRFDYGRNAWVEGEINISGGMGSNSRLSGQYRVTNRNTIKVSGLKATGGRFDASRNGDTYGSFTINCNGNIEGYLRDYNGNTKDVSFEKR